MTITSQVTRRGKEIHRLSLGDLIDAVESGERLRAYCPIHGGDHQRSLSIALSTGWGFCHSCHAIVLVEAMNSTYAGSRTNTQVNYSNCDNTLSAGASADPLSV